MLARRIIPCLDVKDGRVVKGINFVGLRDAGDPVECAARYSEGGADEICFLDITASHDERRTLFELVERTARAIAVPLTVGGGVRERRDVHDLLHAGADKVSTNSGAVANRRGNLASIINQSTGRLQLQVSRLQPNARGDIQVRLENAVFDDLLAWLYEMEFREGLLVREVSIARAGAAGRVNATVRIAQAG